MLVRKNRSARLGPLRAIQSPRTEVFRLTDYDAPSVRDYRQRTVIVAVIAVRMVEASVDQVIKVVSMRNRLMATAWAMPMRLIMSGSAVLWIAPIGIGGASFNHVFINAPAFNML